MEILTNIIQEILNIGAIAFLPIIVTVLGLIFRMKFFEAFKSGLLFGIGFQGLKLVISLLTTTIQPIIDYYAGSGASRSFTTVSYTHLDVYKRQVMNGYLAKKKKHKYSVFL